MPYLYEKINPNGKGIAYDKEAIASYAHTAKTALCMDRELVGVKLIFVKGEYEAFRFDEPKAKLSYCKLIELASNNKARKSKLEHHLCDGGTTALALENSTAAIESGETYFSYGLYATKAGARRMRSSIASLHAEMPVTYGIITAPLQDFEAPPDVIIFLGNPYQMMRITQGYVYHSGIKPQLDYGAMQALCAELTARPYQTGEMNISAFCPSTRMLCKWSENEMGASVPFEMFVQTVDGILATGKV